MNPKSLFSFGIIEPIKPKKKKKKKNFETSNWKMYQQNSQNILENSKIP